MRTVSAWSTFAGLAGVVLQCRLVELAADAGAISGLVHLIAIAVLLGGTVGVVAIGFPQGIRLSVVFWWRLWPLGILGGCAELPVYGCRWMGFL